MTFLEKEPINTGRQIEADIAKFVCLVGMVIVHCFDVFVSFSEISSGVQYVFLFVLNCIFGAGTFMFCMGIGIAYSRNNAPELLMKRGVKLFLLGYLLNLICAASYLLLLKDLALFVTYAVGLDIMQFAGLALFLFGLLLRVRCPDWGIGVIALVFSLIGTFVHGVDLGSPAANIFCGLFIGSFDYEWLTGGIFPLINWFIFVVSGYLFAKYLLQRCKRKSGMYLLFSGVSAVIVAVYMIIAIPKGLGMMGSVLRFHHIGLPEAVICIAGAVFALGVYYLLSGFIPAKAKALITDVSRNINAIYCIQWVVLAWSVSIWVICGKKEFSDGMIILLGLIIFLFSAVAAHIYARLKARKKTKSEL